MHTFKATTTQIYISSMHQTKHNAQIHHIKLLLHFVSGLLLYRNMLWLNCIFLNQFCCICTFEEAHLISDYTWFWKLQKIFFKFNVYCLIGTLESKLWNESILINTTAQELFLTYSLSSSTLNSFLSLKGLVLVYDPIICIMMAFYA